MASNVPAKIGKYDVIDVIGRGGMGVVYKAIDPHLDRTVAIKMITAGFAENPAQLRRFFVEAKSLASLVHPNIVTVYDLGDFNGNPYLVMQYLEGEDLDTALVAKRQLSLFEKTNVIIQVCEGLGYAHRRDVIHRDIKPANIMLCRDSSIKIFDFGIAKMGDQNITKSASQIVGTLYYMSPEQVNGQPLDGRTDLFSTGVVLYQLVTNYLPFKGENTTNTLLKITREPPPPLRDFLSVYPPELEAIVLRALAKDREERYQSADEMAFDLCQIQGHLKQELIARNMEEVAVLMERTDLYKAKDRLIQVLKIDQQNTCANSLLRDVLGQIQRQEVNAQVTKLRERAEEALAHNQYPVAQECLDRAFSLDKNNAEVGRLRQEVRQVAEDAEKLYQALRTAEAAHSESRLDAAKEAVEEALELAPDDAQAKALYRLIHRDWVERSRQKQMDSFLADARQEISARRFTAALEILKEAEALDPKAPQVQALVESATAGQDQERRRKELDAITREVEEALNRDDYRTACAKAGEGLSRFPGEGTLLRLQVLAEKQRQVEERRLFVDEQLAMARQLLQEKRNEELLKRLEKTLAEIGPEPRLQSLLSIVRENLQRERLEKRKADCLQKAGELLHSRNYDEALLLLENAVRDLGEDAEIREYMEKVRAERSKLVQGTIRRVQQESSLDLRSRLLEEALSKSPNEAELQDQLESVQRLGKLVASIASEARALEQAQQFDQALVKWEALRGTYRHYPDLEKNVERVKRLRDEAQVDTHASWVRKIESAMNASDYVTASTLVAQAEQEFPWDPDLMDIKERVAEALKLRAKAQKGLAEGQKLLASQQWEEGANAIVRACRSAAQDRMIQERGVSELQQACKNAGDKNWRAAEILAARLSELQPSAVPTELDPKIRELKKENSLAEALGAAKKLQTAGDLQGAARALARALDSYPDESRLKAMQRTVEEQIQQAQEKERQERVRQEKEAFVNDVLQRAQNETGLEGRIRILEEAVRKEPGEMRLQRPLNEVRDLAEVSSSLASEARRLEQAQKYDQALAKWQALREAYPKYPDLDKLIGQTRGMQEQARVEAKGKALREIEAALGACKYEDAERLLAQAKREFAGDREVAAVESRLHNGMERRAEAQKLLAAGMKSVGKMQWQKAAESFQEARDRASLDPVIADQVLRAMVQASEAALKSDLDAAEMLLGEALRVQPTSPLLGPLKSKVQDHKRERMIEECSKSAAHASAAGDFAGALQQVDRVLSKYPDEPTLLRQRDEIQKQARKVEEAQRQVREQVTHRRAPTEPTRQLPQTWSEGESASAAETQHEAPGEGFATQPFDRESPAGQPPAVMDRVVPQAPSDPKMSAEAASLRAKVVAVATPEPVREPVKSNAPPKSAVPSDTHFMDMGGTLAEDQSVLRAIEKELALYVGPMARIMVKRAAAKAADADELYRILAKSLERDADRNAFMARTTELLKSQAKLSAALEPVLTTEPVTGAINPLTPLGITPEAIDHAARMLAAHVGPISGVLAKKAARKADSLQSLYRILSEHVQNSQDRRQFLRDAGFPET